MLQQPKFRVLQKVFGSVWCVQQHHLMELETSNLKLLCNVPLLLLHKHHSLRLHDRLRLLRPTCVIDRY